MGGPRFHFKKKRRLSCRGLSMFARNTENRDETNKRYLDSQRSFPRVCPYNRVLFDAFSFLSGFPWVTPTPFINAPFPSITDLVNTHLDLLFGIEGSPSCRPPPHHLYRSQYPRSTTPWELFWSDDWWRWRKKVFLKEGSVLKNHPLGYGV